MKTDQGFIEKDLSLVSLPIRMPYASSKITYTLAAVVDTKDSLQL